VRLLLGIEGDNDPSTDTHWRMGYSFPVQLTQWALAAAPQHPILKRFISTFSARIDEITAPYGGNLTAVVEAGVLKKEDPLKLTGPEAITAAARGWLADEAGLRWEAVTGLHDGGRSKAVGSTVIFPITAFRYLPLTFHFDPYTISFRLPSTMFAQLLIPRTVLGGRSMGIWARSPSQTLTRGCSTVPRAAGGNSIWKSSSGNFAGRLSGGVGTGRRSLDSSILGYIASICGHL